VTEILDLDDVDALGAGAIGEPGRRTFLIQAVCRGETLSILLEKEQVRLLATEVLQFLERIDRDFPETPSDDSELDGSVRDADPLFRARVLGIGYDPRRGRVVLELREWPDDEIPDELEGEAPEPRLARIHASRAQIRAMARNGISAVEAGRPTCRLCELPMDPDGHWCPRSN
jgi:uncharacterized repeat protein (TIGR03847 family)